MVRALTLFAAAAVAAGTASAASGQSLGEVARREEARRKAVAQPGKVYTNDDLSGAPEAPAAPAPVPPPPAAQPRTPDDKTATESPRRDEAYWRTRVTEVRRALERARTFEEALQSRINALSADFVSRDDPAQRGVIAADRQKALAELDRVRKEIADHQKAIADIEEEARRAGVPPGWLR